ncbi:MAG: glycoside hydrolase family 3 C-terminal domain-containing protein, partial [bacterium]
MHCEKNVFSGKIRNTILQPFFSLVFAVLIFSSRAGYANTGQDLPFRNPDLPIEERVADLVSRLTLEEKISLMYADAAAVPRLGINGYGYGSEALHGVAGSGFTVFPQAIALAATWNPALIEEITTAISDEAWGAINRDSDKDGYHSTRLRSFWSPTVNMARDPRWGRTPETYGEDPYLTSRIGVAFVKGLQGYDPRYIKVVSTPKHFAANNEEHNRQRCNAVISERALREYYFPGFQACVMEGKALSVMGAYNAINGVPCNANRWLMTDVLRGDWGFNGYVVTDCGAPELMYAQHKYVKDGVEAAAVAVKAGVDLECGQKRVFPTNLMESYRRGLITEADIGRALTNLMRVRMRLGMFDPPEMVPYTQIPPTVIGSEKHVKLARRASDESIVLLKNEEVGGRKLLPLDQKGIKSIAVVGFNADAVVYGDYSGSSANEAVTPFAGIHARAGAGVRVWYVNWIQIPDEAEFFPVSSADLRLGGGEGKIGLMAEYFNNTDFAGSPVAVREEEGVGLSSSSMPAGLKPGSAVSIRWSGKLIAAAEGLHHFTVKTVGGFRVYIDGNLVLEKGIETEKKKPAFGKGGMLLDDYYLKLMEKKNPIGSAILEVGREYDIVVEYYYAKGIKPITLKWSFSSMAQAQARADEMQAVKDSDIVIAVMGYRLEHEHESIDRVSLDLPEGQTEYIRAIMAINPNVVVVLINGSPVSINWIAENVPAIVEAWYPGEQGGNAIADVLFGDYNPAGRLPFTFYKSVDDLPPFDDYEVSRGRTYMYLEKEPLYPFGYGLSYTSFEYTNIILDKETADEGDTMQV